MSGRMTASLAIAACAASWGAIGVIVRQLDMPLLAVTFFQELGAALVGVLAALVWRPAALRRPPAAVIAVGLVIAVHLVCLFAAVRETSVASAVLVTYSAPIMIALLAPALLGEHVTRRTVAALAVSGAGVAAIPVAGGDGGGAVHAGGVGLALLAAVTYALFVVLVKRFAADVEPLTVVLWPAAVAALLLSPAALAGGYSIGAGEAGYLVLLGVVLGGVAGIVWVAAIRLVRATAAGILGYLEPLSAVLLAALFLGEEPTGWVAVGGAAIVVAGLAVVLERPAVTAVRRS